VRGLSSLRNVILTGDRPTGSLHLGHYVGSLRTRVELQNKGGYREMYAMIADSQALTDNYHNSEKVRENIIEVALDYLACGIDPEKTTIIVQSYIPELYELTCYFLNLVTLARLRRNPTVKNEIRLRNFDMGVPVGFLVYPVSQAADITAFNAEIVPVGEDQLPMIEQTREIVRAFNKLYGETLTEPEALLPSNQVCSRLPGTDGKSKMSKSLGNCIYLSDPPEVIERKVMSMFTDPNHISINDPGNVKDNPVFAYLRAFCRDEHFPRYLPSYANLAELEAHYERGGLGDVTVKRFLNSVLQEELEPIRKRRRQFERQKDDIYRILYESSIRAKGVAAQTLARVRDAMGINYFPHTWAAK